MTELPPPPMWKSESHEDYIKFVILDQRPIDLLPNDLRVALRKAFESSPRVAIEAVDVMLPSPWLKTFDQLANEAAGTGGSLGLIIGDDEYFNAKTADMLGLQSLGTFPTVGAYLKS